MFISYCGILGNQLFVGLIGVLLLLLDYLNISLIPSSHFIRLNTGKVVLASYLGTIKAMEGTEGSAIHA